MQLLEGRTHGRVQRPPLLDREGFVDRAPHEWVIALQHGLSAPALLMEELVFPNFGEEGDEASWPA